MCCPLLVLLLCVQLRLSQASLEVQKQLAEQQRDGALATVAELEAQLADIGAEIATHMQVRRTRYCQSDASTPRRAACFAIRPATDD